MNLRTAIRDLLIFMVVLLSLVPIVLALDTSKALDEARQLASSSNDGAFSLKDRQEALRNLTAAVDLFLSAGENVEAARVLNRVGRLQLVLNQPTASIESHQRALDLLKHSPSVEIEVDNLNGLVAAYLRIEKEEVDPKTILNQASLLSQQSSYRAGEAEALILSSELENHESHQLALETAKKALALFQILDDKAGLVRAYHHIGQYYQAQQMLADSAENYNKALQLSRERQNPVEQAEALINLGFIEHRKGDWETAISYFTQAQPLLDETAEPEFMGEISAGLADAFNESGLPEIGLTHYQRALEHFRLTEDPTAVRYATWGLGRTYYLLGDFEEAKNHLEQVLAAAKPASAYSGMSHQYLGYAYFSTREYDVALQHLLSALPIFERLVNPWEEAQVRGMIGQVYQQQGDIERARQYYQQALNGFTRMEDRVNLAVIYFALGRLELTQGNLNVAETYLRQSIEATEDMRRVSTSSDLTAAFSASVHERYESYIECLMRKHNSQPGQDLNVRAFEMSEQSRGRSLVELLHATQTGVAPGLDPQLAEQEKSLRQSLRVKEDSKIRLLAAAYQSKVLAALDGDISQLEAQYKQVLDTIKTRYPAFEQINNPTIWDVRKVQEEVVADDQTLLLEYSLGADRSYVWAITRDRIASYELPSETVINDSAKKVYNLLATHPGQQPVSELDQATQELSRLILSPVALELNKRRILVVADGALNYIPFQVLPSPSADREQLLVAHEIINAPSASILGQLQQETARRQPATNVLAAFGDPIFDTNFAQQRSTSSSEQLALNQTPNDDRMQTALRDIDLNGDSFDTSEIKPLFYAKQELANLRDVAGDETLIETGFNASLENLQHTDLTKYSILHFATHGLLNPKRPESSGLVLSTVDRSGKKRDGFVGLSNIYNLHAPVDLVVLSACRTGLGKDVRGEGLIGITRGFMYAGASSVVASLWKVDDEATAELMKFFYTNLLKNGMTPAAALSAAQNSIRQQKRWSSPYYWAAFTIQGDSRSVIKAKRTGAAHVYENIVALAALLVLMAFVGWSYRRHVREMRQERL
jgi:CHAT domain-containing protein/Tfp pilus assembly protein PilF